MLDRCHDREEDARIALRALPKIRILIQGLEEAALKLGEPLVTHGDEDKGVFAAEGDSVGE